MNRRTLTTILMAALLIGSASSAIAHHHAIGNTFAAQSDAPINKDRLVRLLKLNDSTQQELIQIITRKGVDFQPSAGDEKELRQAGASDDLIAAVRANYRAAGNNGVANAAQNSAPANQQTATVPEQNNAQTNQQQNAPQTPPANPPADAQSAKTQASTAPEVGFHGFQVGTYKGEAKDNQIARVYGTDTQKLEFKIDKIDAGTGKVHAGFFAEHYRSWDLNGTIDEEGVMRLEGSPVSPGLKIIAHVGGGVITAKYRDESHGVDGGEFTVKFEPDEFGDDFNKKSTTPKRNN